MNKFSDILKDWNVFEVIWIIISSLFIILCSICFGDSFFGVLAAFSGIVCLMLTANGKVSCYIWGILNAVFCSYIGFTNRFLGIFALNLIYYVPMQILGFYYWYNNFNFETNTVKVSKMKLIPKIIVIILCIAGTFTFGKVLEYFNGTLPYLDAAINTLSFIAMILSIKRYKEQWILYIAVDIISIVMWAYVLNNGSPNISMLLMWSIYLINSIWGYIKWSKSFTF